MENQYKQQVGIFIPHQADGEMARAYVPPLFPQAPKVRLGGLQLLFKRANQSLGRFDGLASVLPDLGLTCCFSKTMKHQVFRFKTSRRSRTT